jgi:glutamate N-acetyltransferase / amino-acid N-acetyltransferase
MNATSPADPLPPSSSNNSPAQATGTAAADGKAIATSGIVPAGFQFGAVTAGIKASGKPDFAVVLARQGTTGAAMFTSNRVVAAPVTVGRRHLIRSHGRVRAVAVNSGNANCATGTAGLEMCQQVCAAAADVFGCEAHEVFPSSTGIIGVPLPGEKLIAALPAAQQALGDSAEHFASFSKAILTTDTRAKIASAAIDVDGQAVRLLGCCKGAGMIHPQLVPHATMLVYLFTDAAIGPKDLSNYLTTAAEATFNRISIDGDTSTNDTVLLLASGASGVSVNAGNGDFRLALETVCKSLALQIVADGEGVTHVVELTIEGAPGQGLEANAQALRVAKAIAHSPLVKTAWAGGDPNWGRLLAAIGYSGVAIDPDRVSIWFGDQPICVNGGRAPEFDESAAHAYIQQHDFSIRVDLGLGAGTCTFWTTDLTTEYVHINADYSS